MQKRPFYLPANEYYRWKWLLNFAEKLPNYALTFGIEMTKVDAIEAASAIFNFVMVQLESVRKTEALLIIAKNGFMDGKDVEPSKDVPVPKIPDAPKEVPPSVLPNIFDLVIAIGDSILKNINATPEILLDLKLVPPSESGIEIPKENQKPVRPPSDRPRLKVTASGASITGEITRGNQFKNTNALIYVNRGNGNDYSYLTSAIGKTFNDTAVFQEGVDRVTYSYQTQLVDKYNKLVGKPSEPFTITVMRPLGG